MSCKIKVKEFQFAVKILLYPHRLYLPKKESSSALVLGMNTRKDNMGLRVTNILYL